tara:strand:+ start:1072 stop:1350 length:279 start_codon:yes stop_codon:yes gene_type:complete
MGFNYGTRDNMLICKDFHKITDGAIDRKIRQNKIGDFIANNLIYQYKRHKNNYFFMQELIDDAFTAYRWVSYVKYQHNRFLNKQFVKIKRLN